MNEDDVFRHAAVDTCDIEGEVMVYDGEELTLLSGSSAAIWLHIDGVRTAAELADALSKSFAGGIAEVRRDVLAFLEQLADKGLVVRLPRAPASRYSSPDHVGWLRDGHTCLLIDLEDGRRRVLTPTGSRVWELICEIGLLEPVLTALRREYPDAPASLGLQVQALLNDLVEERLLCRSD